MSVFVVGSLRGSPGVTTAGLLLADCFDRGVLVEADRDGGVLAVRHGLGREPGLTTLAGERSGAGWHGHAQSIGGVPVLVGPESPQRMATLWSHAGDRLVGALSSVDGDGEPDAVVDIGRFSDSWPPAPLAQAASTVVVLVRPTAEQLVALSQRTEHWSRDGWRVGAVFAGQGPYRPSDMAELGVPVIGVLPADRRAAEIVTAGGRGRTLARSALARAVRTLADALAASAPLTSGADASVVNGEVSR